MKKLSIAFASLALLSTAAFAGKEICFEKHVIANYVGGTGTFVTCNSTDTKHVDKDICKSAKR